MGKLRRKATITHCPHCLAPTSSELHPCFWRRGLNHRRVLGAEMSATMSCGLILHPQGRCQAGQAGRLPDHSLGSAELCPTPTGAPRGRPCQHLPLCHHQHLQGDDVLQRLPHPRRLPQLHAQLQDHGVLPHVRPALRPAAPHPLQGESWGPRGRWQRERGAQGA